MIHVIIITYFQCVINTAKGEIVKRIVPIWITFALIFASIVCMAFGIYRGELDTVLTKAINICMECIGLG